jgi:hypothetical protein
LTIMRLWNVLPTVFMLSPELLPFLQMFLQYRHFKDLQATPPPPQAIATAEREMDELIQAIEDSHEDDEHLPPAQDEDEDEDEEGDDNVGNDVQDSQPVGGSRATAGT